MVSSHLKMNFVGRTGELEKIRKQLDRSDSSIVLVYGRRRIGKTELIRTSLGERRAVFFEGLENRSKKEQLTAFIAQLNFQFREADLSGRKISTWLEAFELLHECLKAEPAHIVFDEFQWMANYRADVISELKLMWDGYLSKIPGTTLILSGSIASFMLDKVLNSSALYGRIESIVHLTEFSIQESNQFLESRGSREVWDARMLFGGVPQYLELASRSPSIGLAVKDLYFHPEGYLFQEYDRIFVSHFGRNPNYGKVIRCLSEKPYGLFRDELLRRAGVASGSSATSVLRDLEAAGFIRLEHPFDQKGRSRIMKYSLADAYLRFYFQFVEPNTVQIKQGNQESVYRSVIGSGAYHNWMGRAFEQVCMDHAHLLSKILGFDAVNYTFGSYFRSYQKKNPGVQMDLIFDRADHVMTLCEIKNQSAPVGLSVIAEVERKVEVLRNEFPKNTICPVLISFGEVTGEVVNRAWFSNIIQADDILKSG